MAERVTRKGGKKRPSKGAVKRAAKRAAKRESGEESPSQRMLQVAKTAAQGVARSATAAARRRTMGPSLIPHLGLVRAPARPIRIVGMGTEITVATYNVHRWTGLNGRRAPDPARAGFVISELDADVIALQEVLRPTTSRRSGASAAMAEGDDPLADLSEALGLHLVFAVTREHKRGQLGNAILSRFPICGTSVLDISHSRLESRGALAAQFSGDVGHLGIVATHLSLVDRTRRRQVQSLLDHPQLNSGPAILLGDMNAWRNCKATRELGETMTDHNNLAWPPSFPAAAPVLALDRIYTQRAEVVEVRAHDSAAARRASDHLPVVARVRLEK